MSSAKLEKPEQKRVKGLYGLFKAYWQKKSVDHETEENDGSPEPGTSSSTVGNGKQDGKTGKAEPTGTVLDELKGFDVSAIESYDIIHEDYNEYSYIHTYIKNSQEHGFSMEVENIVRVTRPGEEGYANDPRWSKRFRLMLWHGTKADAVAQILKDGFRKPLPRGQMFGNGIYFADRASKSVRYCFGKNKPENPKPNDVAYLLLCDILVGKAYNAKHARRDIENAPATRRKIFDSVKCTGENIPDISEQVEFGGAQWPIGKTVKNTKFEKYTILYNEYIVYDPDNIKIKYVVKVKIPESK